MASDKRKYVTSDQKAILVDFIRTNSRMIKPKFDGTFTIKDCNRLWEELTVNLNNLDGAKKSSREWRKCWHDLRRNTKEKVAKLRKQQTKSGEGAALQEDLTPIQEKVIGIIEGHENAQDSMMFLNIKQEFVKDEHFMDNAAFDLVHYREQTPEFEMPPPPPLEENFDMPVPETSTPKRWMKPRTMKRLKSIAEKKLSIKKSYYDRKLALLKRHIQAIDRQTDAINKQTVVHEKLMQLLSRKPS